ncbi:MAG TPA: nucleoside hydrolase, partial [Opitutaceae bacterium]|nr:nucleoside hydrolase [Opitutaceae bacterium]
METSRRQFVQSLAAGTAAALLPLSSVLAAVEAPSPALGRKRVIIDSDTATDDALAILLAARAPNIKIEAVTITVGNVGFEQQTKNALYTLEIAGKSGEVPVYQGSSRPLFRQDHRTATYVHGTDGMSDSFFPEAKQKPDKEHAVDAIIRLVHKYPGEITIAAIGPLTNIALALLRDPSIAEKIASIHFMGGAYRFYGNITPLSTYNPWVDPEAAKIVFQSGVPIVTAGFDISNTASIFTDADYLEVEKFGTKFSDFFLKINRIRRVYCKEHQKMKGSNHPDALALALVIDSSIGLQMLPRFVGIETEGEYGRGALAIDELGVYGKPPNATVCAAADETKFKKLVM